MSVGSEKLGISGQCDIVEFHRDGRIIPVEYKRGKPKSHHADEVQLCAQALCLEDMIEGASISIGYLFYGKPKRRKEVPLDDNLRTLTLQTIDQLQVLIRSAITPLASYEKQKCDACSLMDICQPKALSSSRSAQSRFISLINSPA
jgi:CRISPR-associated exonuclease Cas4